MSHSFDSCWEVQRGDAVKCLICLATTRSEEVKLHRELNFNPKTHNKMFFCFSGMYFTSDCTDLHYIFVRRLQKITIVHVFMHCLIIMYGT